MRQHWSREGKRAPGKGQGSQWGVCWVFPRGTWPYGLECRDEVQGQAF
jgi:hypothetical protein